MFSQKISTAELMITTVKLKSITDESSMRANGGIGHGVVNRCGRASCPPCCKPVPTPEPVAGADGRVNRRVDVNRTAILMSVNGIKIVLCKNITGQSNCSLTKN